MSNPKFSTFSVRSLIFVMLLIAMFLGGRESQRSKLEHLHEEKIRIKAEIDQTEFHLTRFESFFHKSRLMMHHFDDYKKGRAPNPFGTPATPKLRSPAPDLKNMVL